MELEPVLHLVGKLCIRLAVLVEDEFCRFVVYGTFSVGFAAETQNVVENAQKKMAEKNLDMIVSNDVLAPGAGFAVDTNSVTIMARGAEPVRFSGTKDETASRILDSVSALAAGK